MFMANVGDSGKIKLTAKGQGDKEEYKPLESLKNKRKQQKFLSSKFLEMKRKFNKLIYKNAEFQGKFIRGIP